MTAPTWGSELDWTLANRWRRNKSIKTHKINSNHITNYCGRSLPISRLSKTQWWLDLINELLDQGKSPSTVNRILSAGSTVLNASRKAQRHKVQLPEFDRMKENKARMFYYTRAQVKALCDTAILFDRKDLADAILFSALTGVRQGELLKLKGSDIDLEYNQIWVGGMSHLRTKAEDCRNIPIAEELQPIIKERKDNHLIFGNDWNNKDQLYACFCKIRDHLSIPHTHVWHSLRDTFGTWMAESNSPKVISALLGHSSILMTMKYIHVSEEANRSAISTLRVGAKPLSTNPYSPQGHFESGLTSLPAYYPGGDRLDLMDLTVA